MPFRGYLRTIALLLLAAVLFTTVVLALPPMILNFEGLGSGTASNPPLFPDANIAVGPNHIVQIVNSSFAVWNKAGSLIYGPVLNKTLWAGLTGAGASCAANDEGQSTVRYDRAADRWVIMGNPTSTTTGSFPFCVAVSKTSDPTGAYFPYAFPAGGIPDSPKLGVWPDAYYITANLFNPSSFAFVGSQVCALDRSSMLSGLAATQQCFNTGTTYIGILPSDLDGATPPPAGSPNYVLSLGATDGFLAFWKFHVDWATPFNSALTGPTILTTSPYTLPCGDTGGACIPQQGTAQQLNTVGERLMYRLAYRNFPDHESLVVNHTVTAGAGAGLRWYELRNLSSTPTIFQQGTYAPSDSNFRWLGSIAMDGAGDMALGFSISSSSRFPTIALTGRLVGDPQGVMPQAETVIVNGLASQPGPPN